MSRSFVAATPDYFRVESAVVSAAPFTVSAWFQRAAAASGVNVLWWLGDSTVDNQAWALEVSAAGAVRFDLRNAGANDNIATSTTVANDTWAHACAVATSSTARDVFLNGGGKTSSVVLSAPAGANRTSLGRRDRASPGDALTGRLGHVAVWNVALADDQVIALANGISPLRMRRSALVAYWPVNGVQSPERNLIDGVSVNLTLFGAPARVEEPPIPHSIKAIT